MTVRVIFREQLCAYFIETYLHYEFYMLPPLLAMCNYLNI